MSISIQRKSHTMAQPKRVKINDLSLNTSNVAVAGVLIAKSDVRLFSRSSSSSARSFGGASTSNRNQNQNRNRADADDISSQRGVITFTIRDAPHSFINCVIWGSDSFVESYNLLFHVGDAVNVLRPSIAIRKNAEEYAPQCSVPYSMTVNEGNGEIVAFLEEGNGELGQVARLPLKVTSGSLQLIDIIAGNCSGGFVDMLVVVRDIRPIKVFPSKRNSKESCTLASFIVMDHSSPGVTFNIWNQAYVERSKSWHRMSTVLQLIDVRVSYSNFSKTIELSTHGRTLIVENPKSRETTALLTYASNVSHVDLQLPNSSGGTVVDLSSIKIVMTIKQISDKINSEHTDVEFTAVLYALIERFDLDGSMTIFTRRCMQCKRIMSFGSELCQNEDCVILQYEAATAANGKYVDTYEIPVDLADHTGSLKYCRIGSSLAEKMLGCSLDQFQVMSSKQRGEIKWKWLLERCTLKMIIKRKTVAQPRPLITIVDCVVSNHCEVLANIKMY